MATSNATGYRIDDLVQSKFLSNPKFCLCLQEYIQRTLSIQIAIIPQQSSEDRQSARRSSEGYMIHLVATNENRAQMEQTVSNFIKNLFKAIQSKTFTDDKVKEWLRYPSKKVSNLKCLQNILDEKVRYVFTVCEEDDKHLLKIYYLAKDRRGVPNNEELDNIIYEKILQETILLPFQYEKSQQINDELERIETNEKVSVNLISVDSNSKIKQKKLILFGYYKVVSRLKKELLNIIENYQIITFQLNSFFPFQIEFLLRNSFWKLKEIEEKYQQFGVELRLKEDEFSAPLFLKEEIESDIKQLLSHSPTATFKSIELTKGIAEIAEKYLKHIARKNRCYIMTELKYKARCYTIPKALPSNIQVPKSVVKQSEQFLSSSDVFSRIVVTNGAIEIRTGDIALQKVDTIVISSTFNGLKEGVIERAGQFEYERTYTDAIGTKLTETNGGKLNCKRILFSNWTPATITNDDNDLRKSVELFISNCIECSMKDQNSTSIAFAVSDSCISERLLAQTMIETAKQQLESKNLHLKISFILLPEQQILRSEFFTLIESMQDIYAQFEWPATVIKTTLLSIDTDDITRCQEKILDYLKRCITSTKVSDSNSIFLHWDQHSINTFYQYCKDKYVLAQIHRTKKELELTGPVNNVLEVKRKFDLLSDLAKEKALYIPTLGRPDTGQTKVYNMMISYCQQDTRKCQCLINRFSEAGFSIWSEPVIAEQHRNAFTHIDKSDCILLCISEDYHESQLCEAEARYAVQTGKQVFLVKIQNDPLIGWQRRIFDGKYFFQLFGSENHFDLEFGKLLLEIFRYTKPGYASLKQKIPSHLQMDSSQSHRLVTAEQRRSMYDERIKTLMKIGRIDDQEMRKLIQQVENVMNDNNEAVSKSNEQDETTNDEQQTDQPSTKDFTWMERWLRKATNVTKQNLPPFASSGDINDALFPMPEFILKGLNLHVPSISLSASSLAKFGNVFEHDIIPRSTELPFTRVLFNPIPVDQERRYGDCTPKLEVFDGLSQVFLNDHPVTNADSQTTMRLPLLSPESILVSEIRRHRESNYAVEREDTAETVAQDTTTKYERPTREQWNIYFKKFAQQMDKNAIQFKAFCSATEATRVVKKK